MQVFVALMKLFDVFPRVISTFKTYNTFMRRSFSDDAIVLRTYDVGEGDRFCILLTRKHGKISARAKGVRKVKSRKGGSLLPLHIARVDIDVSSSGNYVSGASSSVPTRRHGLICVHSPQPGRPWSCCRKS